MKFWLTAWIWFNLGAATTNIASRFLPTEAFDFFGFALALSILGAVIVQWRASRGLPE